MALFFSTLQDGRANSGERWQQWVKESLSADGRVAARSRLALALRVVGGVLAGFCVAAGFGSLWPLCGVLGTATVLMGILGLRLERGVCPRGLSHLMLCGLTLVFVLCPIWDGQLHSLSLYLVPILPVLGLFVLGRRVGLVYAFAALAVTVGVPAYFGVADREPPFANQTWVWMIVRLVALGLSTCFGVLSAALFERHIYRIESSRRELKMQVERVSQARLAKREFLATMSHEIRTPMNGVLGMTQLLARSKSLSDRAQASKMHRWAEQLLALLNRVLELAKIDSSQFDGRAKECDLKALLERLVTESSSVAKSKGIQLQVDPALESYIASVSLTHLHRALGLLLENTFEHSKARCVEFGLREDPLRPDGVWLTLKDDGQGLSPRLREQINDVLHRGYHLIEGKGEGSGLGIVVAHRLLAALGVELELDPSPGCAWSLWIPKQGRPCPQAETKGPADSVDPQMRARQIKLNIYIGVAFVFGMAYLVQSVATARHWGAFVGCVLIFAQAVAFVLNRKRSRTILAAWIFLAGVWLDNVGASFADGQLHSATLWLIPTCPLLAATLLGMRASFYSGIGAALGIVGVSVISRNWHFQAEYDSAPEQLAVFRVVLLILFTSLGVVAYTISRRLAQTLTAQHKDLAAAQQDAEAADEETTRFLDAMSRKIGQPMRDILGAARVLGKGPVSEKDRSMLETITRSGRHLLVLMNETMDISRAESSIVELQDQAFCLNELVGDVERLFAPKAELTGLKLETVVPSERIEVVADVTKVLQILCNLVGNALKFSHRGTVSVVLEAPEQVNAQGVKGRMVSLSVQDQGVGISKEQQLKIFDDYVQLGASYSKSAEGGTGLGLSICSKLAKLMGGEIDLHSELGQGARFTLRVWLPSALDLVGSRELAAPDRSPAVLVVDDNAVNRRVVQANLDALGVSAVLASSGAQAIGLVRNRHFELILMDLRMPGLSGFETIARLQDQPGPTPHIAAFSAEYSAQDVEQLHALGISDRLQKPLRQLELEAILKKVGLLLSRAA